MTTTEAATRCPDCGNQRLAQVERQPRWCPACEWNLAAWPPPPVKSKRRQRAIQRSRAAAFAINAGVLAELQGRRPERPVATRTRTVLTAVSLALALVDLALLVLGLVAVIEGNWPLRVVGVFAIAIAIECRPRVPRIDPAYRQVERADAPQLYELLDDAADALGAPRVDVLLLDDEYDAWCARSGLRRRVVVCLGLPLWGALSPAGRQALLGHELGHLVNGDPGRGFLTQPAMETFGRLADLFDPREMVGAGHNPVHDLLAQLISYPLFGPVHLACRWADDRLQRVAARDHQRAEVYADALAARLGGRDGAAELQRLLLFLTSAKFAIRQAAQEGSADPSEWQRAAVDLIAGRAPEKQRLREQQSLREDVSLYASHPPPGLRLRLVRSWPPTAPDRPVPVARMAAADAELARRFESVRRSLLNRTFG